MYTATCLFTLLGEGEVWSCLQHCSDVTVAALIDVERHTRCWRRRCGVVYNIVVTSLIDVYIIVCEDVNKLIHARACPV